MSLTLIIAFIVSFLAIAYALYNYFSVKAIGEGTDEMKEISTDIRIGANTFLKKEFKVLASVMFFEKSAIALVVGAVMSSIPALFGMKMSTLANVRVTNTAMETKSIGKSQKVALRAGSVMGLSVAAFSLVGF